RAGPLDTMVALARRELWEHRSLWIAPLVVEGLLAISLLLGRINMDLPEGVLTAQQRIAIFTIVQWALAQPLFIVTAICVAFYLLDCLYAERKDRSILFWKSLPLSDELTVASKFLVAAVVVPLGVFLLAAVAGLVFAAIIAVRVPGGLTWSTYEWLRTELVLLLEVILGVLWYSPIAGALLLFSAWIRRNPILWASLVPVVAPVVERVALGTHYIWNFEVYRTNGIWHKLTLGPDVFGSFHHLPPVGVVLDTFNIRGAFTDIDLWSGVIAAIAMAYAAARVRRYRDDT
ncbi:MAG TPA: ABC-2 transporter permease, partial [Steroidobacteraceae bacterium]|nr:ABC-2 transporter permease [Steroidobacteraceae bacterium]